MDHKPARSAGLSGEIGGKKRFARPAIIYLVLNKSNPTKAIITVARLLVDGHSRSAWRNVDPVPGIAPQVHSTSSSAPPEPCCRVPPRLIAQHGNDGAHTPNVVVH